MNKKLTLASAVVAIVAVATAPVAHAALFASSTFSQSITNGTASTDIRDNTNAVIATPTINMNAVTASTSQQNSTGTFGSSTQRITIDNPGAATTSWTLTLNASVPGTSKWTSGGNNYLYNGTAATGQLTVSTGGATYTVGSAGTSTGIAVGAGGTFSGSTAVTLATGTVAGNVITNGYFGGFGLTQTIPAGQATGTYTLPMVQTLTVS